MLPLIANSTSANGKFNQLACLLSTLYMCSPQIEYKFMYRLFSLQHLFRKYMLNQQYYYLVNGLAQDVTLMNKHTREGEQTTESHMY